VTKGPVDPTAAGGRLRASDADRERALEELKVAFAHGRLAKDELDRRAGRALTARTYGDLAAATAGVPARPPQVRPAKVRPQVRRQVRRRPARAHDQPPANTRALKWGLALATLIVPATMAGSVVTGSKDLFCVSVVLLMAYVLTVMVALANAIAVRFENELPGERPPAAR